MEKTKSNSGEKLYKAFIYVVLITLAVLILVPVAWVFMASVKQNSEFYGNPWTLPASFYWQNFVDAWNAASMGSYMLNSVIVTALSLALLLVVALPAAYCLSRFQFKGSKLLNIAFMAGLFINVNYIVVPIFLMLRDWESWMQYLFGLNNIFMNNLFTLAVVYAATALPFTIYLLSGYFATLPYAYEEAAYIDGAGYGTDFPAYSVPSAASNCTRHEIKIPDVLCVWRCKRPFSYINHTHPRDPSRYTSIGCCRCHARLHRLH